MRVNTGALRKWVYAGVSVLVLFIAFTGAAFAQSDTGTITGTITDPKGLAMSGASVLVHNADTGADLKPIVTTDAGIYVLTLLPPGNYDVTASQTGFSTVQHKGVMLEVGQTVRIDFSMPVATQQSLVTVTTEVPVLETEKTENSQNINEDLVSNLPVSSRRWEQLALLTPGVSYDGTAGAVSFRGLGGEYNQNSVDGANNEDSYDETTRGGYNESYVYSSDSIREFQVASSGFNAELGQAAGGSVNAVTKSGTSMFHGDLFYSGRSPSFNAYDPVGKTFAASTGTVPTQPVHQQNQWGGSFGGPIIKDKLFFFVTDDGFRKVEPNTVTTTQLNPSIDNLVCPNPATVTAAQCLAAKQFADAHFYGVFPRDMRQDVELIKLDYQINQSYHFNVVSNIRDYHLPSSPLLDNNTAGLVLQDRFVIANLSTVIGTDKVNEFRYQWGKDNSISDANVASPAPEVVLTNLFTYGSGQSSSYTDEIRNQFSDNFSITKGTHTIKFGVDVNLVSDDVQGSVTADGPYTYNNVALPAAVTAGGGCTLPAGNTTASQQANTTFCDWLIDLYRYNTGSAATTGNHFSSFGQTVDTVGTTPNNFVYNMPFDDIAGYIQDTWKARPNITVNYGLRYDAQLFPHLPYSVAEVFPNADQPIFDYYTSKYPDTLNGLQPRLGIAWNFRKTTVLRIGGGEFVAETAGHNLKNVYSGAGEASVSCNAGACTTGYPTPAGQPFAGLEFPDLFVSQNANVPLANIPLPGAATASALYSSAANAVTIPNPKFSIRGADPNLQAARAYEAEIGIEQQLPGNMNFSVQYVFTRGNHLPRGQDGNIGGSYDPVLCSSAATTAGVTQNSCGTSITKPYDVTDANGNVVLTPASTGLLALPLYSSAPAAGAFPGFTSRIDALTGGIPSNTSTINTTYNGLNVTLRKPMSHGLEVLANYTLAHALDNGDVGGTQLATVALDPRNNRLEYGNSTTDVRNRFTASVVYAPTVFQNSGNKIEKDALGGWAISTTITATNGVHYTGQASGTSSQTTVYCGAAGPTCDFTGYALPGSTTLLPAPITFTGLGGGMTGAGIGSTGTPAGSRISWEPNGFYVLPNLYDVDLRLIKQVSFKERYHFELRLEAFNLFNSTLVQAVSTNAYSYTKPGAAIGTGTCPTTAITCMSPLSTFQQASLTSGNLLGARQLQAGLRFEF